METPELIVTESPKTKKQTPVKEFAPRRCTRCGATEGKIHPLRKILVVLQPLKKEEKDSPLVCLICRLDYIKKEVSELKQKKNSFSIMNKYMITAIIVIAILLILSSGAFAQPNFPSQPEQTPIDGGLGILAAAGGAYALKKLKDRKNSETH